MSVMRSGPRIVTGVSIAVGTGTGSLCLWGTCCDAGFFCKRRPILRPSENALRCRARLTDPTDGVEEAFVEVESFRLCFEDRVDCAEDAELDVLEAFEYARDRVRSSVDVAGEESAEKWLPVV